MRLCCVQVLDYMSFVQEQLVPRRFRWLGATAVAVPDVFAVLLLPQDQPALLSEPRRQSALESSALQLVVSFYISYPLSQFAHVSPRPRLAFCLCFSQGSGFLFAFLCVLCVHLRRQRLFGCSSQRCVTTCGGFEDVRDLVGDCFGDAADCFFDRNISGTFSRTLGLLGDSRLHYFGMLGILLGFCRIM